jgi:uncharacterized protein YggE
MITYSDAIISLGWVKPTAIRNGVIDWCGEEGIPLSTIQSEVTRLQAEYDSQEYARLRRSEYDKLNQFEMRYDDLKNGTSTWEDAIDAIKLQFPKGGV